MQIMDGINPGNPAGPTKSVPNAPEHTPTSDQDDLEAGSASTVDVDQFMPQLNPKHMALRVTVWVIVLLMVLAAIGGGAYYFMHHKTTSSLAKTSGQRTAQNQVTITQSTKNYISTNFNLSFNYPQDWSVSDTGNGKLTATSPDMQLTKPGGQPHLGQVVMTIQNESSANFDMFKQGNAVAVLASQHIAYSNPTPTQRANTYISFLQYETTTAQAALDGVYVTGDFGYQKGQSIPEVDITKVDPVITITFNQCSGSACTGTLTPMTIDSSMWNDANFSGPITKMIESLAIQ